MSIISKETFDKFTETEKKSIQTDYQDLLSNDGRWIDSLTTEERNGAITQLEWLFDKENLQPKPKVKTWEDVEKIEGGKISVDSKVITPNGRAWGLNIKYHNKAEATLKLAILIELGYGGMIKEEEWKNNLKEKYCITWAAPNQKFHLCTMNNIYHFIAFHTPEQRDEFMSYPENVELVRQYYMI